MSHIDYFISGTKKGYESEKTNNIKDEVNYFGLIQFEGKIQDDGEKQRISEKIITNSLKTSDGKEIKAPLDTSINIIFHKTTKYLTFNGETLKPKNILSFEKVNELIKNHNNWNGEKVSLEITEK
ncbi:hypothetical protein [Winogradskyella undariae]|uniref:hypothetical protein n=1 Tax=Winogradskyella undariae TaxID=1285465 RepID=UPI0015CABB20|nr:hypothetical protein [Winogradskyella undariae]